MGEHHVTPYRYTSDCASSIYTWKTDRHTKMATLGRTREWKRNNFDTKKAFYLLSQCTYWQNPPADTRKEASGTSISQLSIVRSIFRNSVYSSTGRKLKKSSKNLIYFDYPSGDLDPQGMNKQLLQQQLPLSFISSSSISSLSELHL